MSPLYHHRLDFRTALYYAFLALLGLLFTAYALFQARFLIEGPEIFLSQVPTTVQHQRVVTLEGQTANIVSLHLNGREIYTDKNGYFKEALVLENGYTVATLKARDRYGRTRQVKTSFVYVPVPHVTATTSPISET